MSIFSKVAFKKVPSNTFDLSHQKKLSAQFGELTPTFLMDIVPGDVVNLSSAQLVRFAPLVAPVMHNITVYQHYFFVPNRILWDNWEDFITGGENGFDISTPPTLEWHGNPSHGRNVNRLGDLFGLPLDSNPSPAGGSVKVDALPFAAYQEIYNEYYRDQNLIDPINNSLIDGDNSSNINTLKRIRKRAWMHDFFTSSLPFTQKGPEALIPLGQQADVIFDTTNSDPSILKSSGNNYLTSGDLISTTGAINNEVTPGGTKHAVQIDNSGQLKVDLTGATSSSINDLRRAFRLQEWLEKNARGGSRYIESILVHFGVKSSDARLQRPEYLGGGATPVQFSEVLQTSNSAYGSPTDPQPTTPQGNMAGHGISAGGNAGFKYRAEEHGHIIGIMSVMPKTAYQQGIERHWRRFDKFDYYWPEFANIGEQPIANLELYWQSGDADNQQTFGYIPRYSEYKYQNDSVHGEMRTDLDFWHAGRKFSDRPHLNQEFIECDPSETSRIFAVEDPAQDQLYVQVNNRVKARRKMPVFGIPSI